MLKERLHPVDREVAGPPGVDAARERPNPRDPSAFQHERHPGARRLVGSAAIENDLGSTREIVATAFQLVGRDADGSRRVHRGAVP